MRLVVDVFIEVGRALAHSLRNAPARGFVIVLTRLELLRERGLAALALRVYKARLRAYLGWHTSLWAGHFSAWSKIAKIAVLWTLTLTAPARKLGLLVWVGTVKLPLSALRAWASPFFAALGCIRVLEGVEGLVHGQFFRRLARFPYFLLGALARYLMFVGLIYFVLVCFLPHGYTVGGVLGTLLYPIVYPVHRYLLEPGQGVEFIRVYAVYPTFSFGSTGLTF